MLPAGTPASGHADQTFHFINNEPNHKQNLSGRVSAACGPPSRRRPKREIESTGPWAQVEGPTRSVSSSSTGNNVTDPASGATSFIIDTSHASRRRESQVSLDPSTPASPRGLLETEVTGPGRSIRPLPARRTLQHILPAWERREQGLSPSPAALQERPPSVSTQRFAHGSAPTMSSPTTNSASQWSPGSQSPPLSTAKAARTVSRPTAQEQAPLSAAPPSSYSMEYASQQDSDISWSNNRHLHRSPDRLIHDAEELEDQATSLRQLALRRRSLDFSARTSQQHMPRHQPASQQQTSQRPPSQQEQMMHFALPSNPHESPFSAYPSQPSYASYNFDLSTMYRADGTLDPRLNPNPTDYGLWDVNTPQEHPQPQPSQGLPWQIGTGHSIQATHAQQTYHNHRQLSQDYLMQAPHLPAPPPPPTTADDSALVTTTQGSVSSGSSTDGTGMARMQRAFYAQLAESEDRRGIGTQGRDPRDSGTKFPKR